MPAKPSYCRDLPRGIAALRARPDEDWVDRQELEAALGVSKTVAWRLMRACGACRGPGGALVCRRGELTAALSRLRDGDGVVAFEVRRRERLAAYLAGIRPEVLAKRTYLVSEAEAPKLVSSQLSSLPSNVRLERGRLEIEFGGIEEFLAAIGSLVYAVNNDLEAVRELLGRSNDSSIEA